MTSEVFIKVDARDAFAGLDRTQREIATGVDRLITDFVRRLRDRIKDNIRTQGAEFGQKWAPPSKWIKAKKNRGTVLDEFISRIHYRVTKGTGAIYYQGPGDYDPEQHEEGFTVAPTGRRVTIELQAPQHLTRKPNSTDPYRWKKFSFISHRASVVPARRIWPTESVAQDMFTPMINKWLAGIDHK